jgi:hypothetical protein
MTEAARGLAELLDRLEEKADEGLARTRLSGRAVSKSADSLHLATSSGLVAIPLSEIDDVSPRGDDPRRVTVSIRRGDRVRQLVRVQPHRGIFTDPIFGDPIGFPKGPGGQTLACYDTTTGTGDETTSDDEICTEIDSAPV